MNKKSEKQNRRWLFNKLKNYLWKIINPNVYGSLKKQKTIVNELIKILEEFKNNI